MTELETAYHQMHINGALRNCASTVIIRETFLMNGHDPGRAIAAGIMSLGGLHAPIQQAQNLLQQCMDVGGTRGEMYAIIVHMKSNHVRVPGYGSSFHKDIPDPDLQIIDELIKKRNHKLYKLIKLLTEVVQLRTTHKLYPNPALYSGAYGIIHGIPAHMGHLPLIQARMPVWTQMLMKLASNVK